MDGRVPLGGERVAMDGPQGFGTNVSPDDGSPDPVLEISKLTKTYRGRTGDKVANDAIDLTVRAGEIVALLGPNGAGKTTLLRQVAGQLLPTDGRVLVSGVDMVRHPLRAKQFLSVIPQECQPKRDLTVAEHIRYFALLKDAREDIDGEVDRLLMETGLTEHRDFLVRELSGGLRRRVLIAVALAGPKTRLLLLDEPTTGVDPEARRSVWGLIDRLRSRRIAILLTTHYIEEAEYLADRVTVIHGGRKIAEGTVEEIRGRLPYRGRLEVRGVNHLSPAARDFVRSLELKYSVATRFGNLVRFEIPDPFHVSVVADLAELTRRGALATLSPASLEDAYLSMVGTGEG